MQGGCDCDRSHHPPAETLPAEGGKQLCWPKESDSWIMLNDLATRVGSNFEVGLLVQSTELHSICCLASHHFKPAVKVFSHF